MGQDLESRFRTDRARHAKLCADIVGPRCSRISSKRDFCEVPTLLSAVLDEGSCIKIGLWHGNIEDAGTR